LTSKNQITLPKSIVQQLEQTQYFEVQIENGRIMLTPMRVQPADLVRNKLAALGISENDIEDAVAWARRDRT
jgi:antitoxin component of MazEF toxin-antitoxin module